MRIKSNGLLKIGVPVLAAVVGVLVLRSWLGGDDAASADNAKNQAEATRQLTPSERKALGVEAESPQDTVSTLIAQMHKMRDQLEQSQKASEKLREQNKHLAEAKRDTQQSIQQALAAQQQQQQDQRSSLVDSLTRKIDHLRATININGKSNGQQNKDMPVGLGLNGETPAHAQGGLTWVNPLGAQTSSTASKNKQQSGTGGASAFSTAFDAGGDAVRSAGQRLNQAVPGGDRQDGPVTPVYTVPKSATLVGSVAMTALLGRVPIDGTVTDPYPFKVVVGAKNLTANGIELPELKGAVVSGTATGDWTLSCVRGKVKSITFVFQDGRVRTVPKPTPPDEDNDNNKHRQIGYLSNPAGVPCVSGTRKTNARSYILTDLLLSAGAAAGGAVAGNETTTSVSGLGATTGVTGDFGKYIAGSSISSGLNEVRKWIQKRFGQTFDAVYVPPGQPVAVNITKQLPIDYEHRGRKVRYEHPTRANGLD